jgi:CDP-diacylglycerol--serine O-phosphatidyltransferase
MRKVQLLPNVITAFGLTCGLFVIFKMNMTPPGEATYQTLLQATAILLLAAFADLLDGAVARVMKAESEFGFLFDSLADAISFGVAPSVVVLKSFSPMPGTVNSFLITTACMVFTVCGVLRLVRFNVTSQQIRGDEELVAASKKNFTGLPIPAAAAAALSTNLFLASAELNALTTVSEKVQTWFLFWQMIILGYFMISRWKFPSLKTLHFRIGSFQSVFLIVVFAVFVFYGILNHFAVVFFLISWAYLFIAWILSIIRLISGKKSKTLEDFEPEPDDLDSDSSHH